VKLPWFGADGQAVTGEIAQTMGLSRPGGVLLKDVYPGGPASRAGLKTGDAVLSIDGVDVEDMQALNYRIATHKAGETVKAHVAGNGPARDVSVTLGLPPEDPPRALTAIGGRNPLTGAKVENLSPAVAVDLDMAFSVRGVVIVSTTANTPSGTYGFQAGDIVRSLNGAEIHSVGELAHALAAANGHWGLVVERGGQRLTLNVDG
jgi:S1-C subfamily serine protease